MTDDEHRAAILNAVDNPAAFVHLVTEYYRNLDRAVGTSRELMYLHIGMACGMIMRQLEARKP